jgi:Protein of unknown function (DUF4065)
MTPKMDKLMEAAMAVLQATPERQLNIVVLNKALFYLDLYALRDLGDVVTGHEYVALPQGPVVDNYKSMISNLTEAGLANQISEQSATYEAKPVRVINSMSQPWSFLSESELSIAIRIGTGFTPLTSSAISQYSHSNPGWVMARRNQGNLKINMRLALQQLCDDDLDPWMQDPFDTATMKICNSAASATRRWD